MAKPTYPPRLMESLEILERMGESNLWSEFAMIGRINVMRHLRHRDWVADIGEKYTKDEPYTGPKLSRFVLTDAGKHALAEWRATK